MSTRLSTRSAHAGAMSGRLAMVPAAPTAGKIVGVRALITGPGARPRAGDDDGADVGQHVEVSARQAYDVARPRPLDRPWVAVCMVSSLDGSTVVDRDSAGLSGRADREVLSTLRSLADVIIVGAQTVRVEGYGPPVKPGQRIGVVSSRGDLDLATPLFRSGAGFLILPEDAPPAPVHTVRAGAGRVDLAGALGQLDVAFVQAEGGAVLNGALAAADVVDELNLTISPQVSGGDGPRLTAGAPALVRPMHLHHVLEEEGFLFTRYVRPR